MLCCHACDLLMLCVADAILRKQGLWSSKQVVVKHQQGATSKRMVHSASQARNIRRLLSA